MFRVSTGATLSITSLGFSNANFAVISANVSTGSIVLDSSDFSNNAGGVIAGPNGFLSSLSVTITNSDFTANNNPLGGGVLLGTVGTLTVTGSTFQNHVTTASGGVFSLGRPANGASHQFLDNTFSHNTAADSAALLLRGATTINNNTFSFNTATGAAAGAVVSVENNSTVTFIHSTLVNNTGAASPGVISLVQNAQAVLNQTLIRFNGPVALDCGSSIVGNVTVGVFTFVNAQVSDGASFTACTIGHNCPRCVVPQVCSPAQRRCIGGTGSGTIH